MWVDAVPFPFPPPFLPLLSRIRIRVASDCSAALIHCGIIIIRPPAAAAKLTKQFTVVIYRNINLSCLLLKTQLGRSIAKFKRYS